MQPSQEEGSVVLPGKELEGRRILKRVDIVFPRKVHSVRTFQGVLRTPNSAFVNDAKIERADHILHGCPDFVAGILPADKDGCFLVLNGFRLPFGESSFDASVFGFSNMERSAGLKLVPLAGEKGKEHQGENKAGAKPERVGADVPGGIGDTAGRTSPARLTWYEASTFSISPTEGHFEIVYCCFPAYSVIRRMEAQ